MANRSIIFTSAVILCGCASGGLHAPAATRPQAPVLARLGNGHYRVKRPWTVEFNGRRWQVEKGYTCNGITAPRRVRESLGDGIDRRETWAAVFHDWLFTQPDIPRSEADRLFHELLRAYGVPPHKATLMSGATSAYSVSLMFR